MKRIIIILLVFAFVRVNAQINEPMLIPQPVEIQLLNGSFEITKSTIVSFNKKENAQIAEMFINKIATATGFKLNSTEGKSGSIQFNINEIKDKNIGNEGYTIESNSKNIIINANEPAGLFYGMQTVLQLLPNEIESKTTVNATWKLPAVKITDYPRFGWRGIMLDVSRHFFTKEDVKKHIDELSRLKFNIFHWHLTDDNGWRIEIKSLPKLTEVGAWRVARSGQFNERELPKPGEPATYGGFYTHEDIKEIIKYAQERNITIIPEIDVPGHSMAAIASYPELSCNKDTSTRVNPGTPFAEWYGDGTFKMLIENTLNPSDEKVYEFLDKVFTEVAELFPSQYIHAGGDECYKGFWANDPGCIALMKKMNYNDAEQLHSYFMNRVNEILKSKGKKLLGWEEGGELAPGSTMMSWRGFEGGIKAARQGHDVVMCPTAWAYIDYQQGEPSIEPPVYASLRLKKCYSFEPLPDGVDPKYILGGQGNLWTEQVPSLRYAQYMTFPRAWALSEVLWSKKELRNWDSFINRVENQFQRADFAEINYSKAIYDPIITTNYKNDKLWLSMESEASNIVLHYTIDGTMPDSFSPVYTNSFELPDGPITLRVRSYRNGKPIGHLIILKLDELKKRAK